MNSKIIDFLIIGTCRVKVPITRAEAYRRNIQRTRIKTHVQSASETLQLLEFISGNKEIPSEILPHAIGDFFTGDIPSLSNLEAWKKQNFRWLQESDKIIIEISTLKTAIINFKGGKYFGHLTNLNKIKKTPELYKGPIPLNISLIENSILYEKNTEKELFETLDKIFEYFRGKTVTLIPHFTCKLPGTDKYIEERISINNLLVRYSKEKGIQFYDPTEVLEELGEEKALKNGSTSHYSDLGEIAVKDRLLKFIQ